MVAFLVQAARRHGIERVTLDARDHEGATPFLVAAQTRQFEVMRVLMEAGADVNAADSFGKTVLAVAAQIWRHPIGWIRGVDVNAQARDGRTPLHTAVIHDRPLMVLYLLQAGADVAVVDRRGRKPVDYARGDVHAMLLDPALRAGSLCE